MFSPRRRRKSRSSSTLSSPRKSNYRKSQYQRLDRHGMKRRRPDDNDQDRRRHSATRTHSYRTNRLSPFTSRRRNRSPIESSLESSDFDDYRRKHSSLKSRRSYSRRPRSNSESDNYRNRKYPVSRNQRRHSRRSSSYSRNRRSHSSDSGYQHHKRPVSKRYPSRSRKSPSLRRRRHSSSDSRDSFHRRRPASVIKKRKPQEMNNSDVDILDGKQKKFCRSRPASNLKSDIKNPDQTSSNMHCYYEKAGKYMEEGKLKKALKAVELALELCESDDKFLSQIYSRKGTIYSLLEKPRCTFQGFLDWERALVINKENAEARKNMSKVLFMGANKYYRMKQYEKALIPCNYALELNRKNGEAFVLQQLLKKKLLDKIKKRDMNAGKLPLVQKSEMKSIPQKTSNVKIECFDDELSISEKVRRLARLAAKAVESNNSPRALIFAKQALRLYETAENRDENIFRQLLLLKQNIKNCNSPIIK